MKCSNVAKYFFASALVASLVSACATAQPESGFTSLFDGQSLNGWKMMDQHGAGYGVKDGVIYCARGGGGNLMTEKEFDDFVLRFEFKLEDGSNNGIGIRTPLEGNPAYLGMEIQILDERAADRGKWGKLHAEQYHGSVYDVIAAKKGALNPPGEWNFEEITARGRHIKVVVNGKTILNANLNDVTDPAKIMKHPGLFREHGHIGLLGHNDYIEFRNLRIKELPRKEKDNKAPDGFTALFNGKDLKGWKGLMRSPLDNPIKRAALSPEERARAQAQANQDVLSHWQAHYGEIAFDGHARSLCTIKDYADFELFVDWKIPEHGDSGIYVRGSPQVQIWDPYTRPTKHGSQVGSGGLYNNKTNTDKPLLVADKPIGQWNRFQIIMVGPRLHVFLNGKLVTRDTVMENYWDYSLPIFPTGQIELQNHGGPLWFKNIYIREIGKK